MGKNFDPNTLQNLAGVSKDLHTKLGWEWSYFRKTYPDATSEQIASFAKYTVQKYGKEFVQ